MKTFVPRLPLRASACSLFLHGAAALGVCLWCRQGPLLPQISSEYVTVIAVEATGEIAAEPASSPAGTPAPAPAVANVEPHHSESVLEIAPRQRLSGPAKIKKRTGAAEMKAGQPAKADDRNDHAMSEESARDLEQQEKANDRSSSSTAPADGGRKEEPEADHGPAGPAADTQSAGPEVDGTAEGDETAGHAAAYLQRNYDYIREIVMRNLSFPAWAKKMRLTGATEVSFIVGTDGEVADIRIEKSSGHELLDMNVVAAVRKSAPFPASPAQARIALPVAFRLK